MVTGIIVCGLNGAGKSTLGKALAEKLNFYFIDNEDYIFPRQTPIICMPFRERRTKLNAFYMTR